MLAEDFATFERAFRRVVGAFRVKLTTSAASELTTTYFRLLEVHPLDDVLESGKTLIATTKRFPLAAEWLAVVSERRKNASDRRHVNDRRTITATELDEYEDAEALRYVAPPCGCSDCVVAGVAERERRFVPIEIDGVDAFEMGFNPRKNTQQICGRWIHGDDLARWYTARDHFFGLARRSPYFRLVEREPGQEG